MSSLPVSHEIDAKSGIARIRFERPTVLNAIDVSTAEAFGRAVRAVAASPETRVILLSGAGRAFVAGGDIAAFGKDPSASAGVVHQILDAINPAVLALRACAAPVIAIVQGVAAGAGLSLVLGADYVLASQNAAFMMAYDKLAASPDSGGTWFLERKVGRTRAFSMMLLGEKLGAEEALAAGIVSEVVPEDTLEARAEALAQTVARGPTLAYGRFKQLIDAAPCRTLADHLEAERAAFIAGTATEDFREGVTAFLNKSRPAFRGR